MYSNKIILGVAFAVTILVFFELFTIRDSFDTIEKRKTDPPIQKLYYKTSKNQIVNEFHLSSDSSDIKQRGSYFVLTNFIKREIRFGWNESITFATPSDFRFIDNLENLVKRWNGPISVTLYAPGSDFYKTITAISYLRQCGDPLIKDLINFHIFFEMEHAPENGTSLNNSQIIDCSKDFLYYTSVPDEALYKKQNNLLLPINVARNIAKEESQTYFVLVADIELNPSPKNTFIEKFLEMVKRKPELFPDGKMKTKQVFVLPPFEVLENQTIPDNKTELLQMYNNKTAFLFHQSLCRRCHEVPGFEAWINTSETDEMDVIAVGKRTGKFRSWEPFYVGTRHEPFFDERISWEGESNKMVQNYLMCLLDYDYWTLNNAFVVHNPGVKKVKTTNLYYGKVVEETDWRILKVIRPQYDQVYGKREGCKKNSLWSEFVYLFF